MSDIKWETAYKDFEGRLMLERITVPGGVIYAVYDEPGGKIAGVVFVPNVPEGADAPHAVCGHGFAGRTCHLGCVRQ